VNDSSHSESNLLSEYKQLSSAAENLVATSFQVPAVALAIVTALAVSGNVNTNYVGFGVLIGMFLLSVWLGYYHSTLNTYGLHLVRIEKRINSQFPTESSLPPDSSERLTYYTDHVGRTPIGSPVYARLLCVLIAGGLAFSVVNTFRASRFWSWPWVGRSLALALAVLTIASFANIWRTESNIHKQKEEILNKPVSTLNQGNHLSESS
jgi:hypothetical protein